jgi:hypothetical protein
MAASATAQRSRQPPIAWGRPRTCGIAQTHQCACAEPRSLRDDRIPGERSSRRPRADDAYATIWIVKASPAARSLRPIRVPTRARRQPADASSAAYVARPFRGVLVSPDIGDWRHSVGPVGGARRDRVCPRAAARRPRHGCCSDACNIPGTWLARNGSELGSGALVVAVRAIRASRPLAPEQGCLCDNKSRARPRIVARVGALPLDACSGHASVAAALPQEEHSGGDQRRVVAARP